MFSRESKLRDFELHQIVSAVTRFLKQEPFLAHILASIPIEIQEESEEVLLEGLTLKMGRKWLQNASSEDLTLCLLNQALKVAFLQNVRGQDKITTVWSAACNIHNLSLLRENGYSLPANLAKIVRDYDRNNRTDEEIYTDLLAKVAQYPQEQPQVQNNDCSEEESGMNPDKNSSNKTNSAESVENDSFNTSTSDTSNQSNNSDTSNEGNARNKDGAETSSAKQNRQKNNKGTNSKKEHSKESDQQASSQYDDNQHDQDVNSGKSEGQQEEKTSTQNSNNTEVELDEGLKTIVKLMGSIITDETIDESSVQQIETAARQIILMGQKAGTMPANVSQAIENLKKPKYSLETIIEEFVAKGIEPKRYNWLLPNKRFSQDFFLPSIQGERNSGILISFDTSGSFWHYVKYTLGLVLTLWESYDQGQEPVHILWCDTEVHYQQWRSRCDIVYPKGGGGTSYRPVMEWIKANAYKLDVEPQALLYITDGECNNFGPDPGIPVFWLVVDIYCVSQYFKPPFGKTFVIHPSAFPPT